MMFFILFYPVFSQEYYLLHIAGHMMPSKMLGEMLLLPGNQIQQLWLSL